MRCTPADVYPQKGVYDRGAGWFNKLGLVGGSKGKVAASVVGAATLMMMV